MYYFDHASGAIPDAQTLDDIRDQLLRCSANQEAVHPESYRARKTLDAAKQKLLRLLTAEPDEFKVILSDSGSTAIALLGSPKLLRRRVLTSKMEHPAVYAAIERSGAEVFHTSTSADGRVTAPEKGDFDTLIFHHIQSETGAIQDLDELFSHFPDALKIADTIQSAGKIALPRNADICTVSGAKLGVPGTAALIVRKKYAPTLEALAEKSRTSYTSSRPVIPFFAAMVNAIERRMAKQEEFFHRMSDLQTRLRKNLSAPEVNFTIQQELSSPYICHLNFPGKEGAVIVRLLGESGITAGSGSACSAESGEPSAALTALGFRKRAAYSGLRVSFDISNTPEEVDFLLEVLKKTLKNY